MVGITPVIRKKTTATPLPPANRKPEKVTSDVDSKKPARRRQAAFYLPEEVLDELKLHASNRAQSKFVVEALRNEFETRRGKKKSSALLDQDILLASLNHSDKADRELELISNTFNLTCSFVTVAQIFALMSPLKRKDIESFMRRLVLIGLDEKIAEIAGLYYHKFRRRRIDFNACLVAATAKALGYTVITGSKKRYPMKDISVRVVTL